MAMSDFKLNWSPTRQVYKGPQDKNLLNNSDKFSKSFIPKKGNVVQQFQKLIAIPCISYLIFNFKQ